MATENLERRYVKWLNDGDSSDDVLEFVRAELLRAAEMLERYASIRSDVENPRVLTQAAAEIRKVAE